jgi:hypothetical protein
MLKEIKIEETVGKTIKTVGYWDEAVVIVFTDGTFVCLVPDKEWDVLVIRDKSYNIFDFKSRGIEIGILTQEEFDQADKDRREQWKKEKEEQEKRQLAILLKKYGRT